MTSNPRDTWEDCNEHAPACPTGPIDLGSIIVEQLAELRRDARDARKTIRDDFSELRRDISTDIHGLRGQVDVLVSGYQRQGVMIGEHMAACRERHRRDSDEISAAGTAGRRVDDVDRRLAVLEQTGVALLNWKHQWRAIVSIAIAAVAAGAALAGLVPALWR